MPFVPVSTMNNDSSNATLTFLGDLINDTMEITQNNRRIIENVAVQLLFYVVYLTIFVLGIFGNVLVCFVVFRNKAMQSVTNFFITNLALSDILLCVLAVPFTPLYSFIGEWVIGTAMCHLVPFSQGVSVYISTLTLTSIAMDRFFVIIFPFKQRMKVSVSCMIICSIWAFSIVATLPYGIFMQLKPYGGKYYCEENWPGEVSRHVFSASTTVLQYVVPFVIITCCYIKVSIKLSDRAKCKPGAKSYRKEELERERKRRTNRMLISMVAIFGCCWLPLNLINLVQDASIDASNWEYFTFFFFIAHAIAMSSTCYNPFLYAWLNENFRKEFKQVLPCFNNRSQSRKCRVSTYCEDKSCNGNETMQESLLPSSANTLSVQKSRATSSGAATTTTTLTSTTEGPTPVIVVYNAPTASVSLNSPAFNKRDQEGCEPLTSK